VDGTLIEAWAGQKSFQRKDRDDDPLNPPPPDKSSNPTINWHQEKRSNETHESLTDAMARLYKSVWLPIFVLMPARFAWRSIIQHAQEAGEESRFLLVR
jgi:hypothetical protein